MPTMGDSPDAEAVLRDIKPNEVSAVDVPAIGEPHIVVKGMSNRLDSEKEKQGGPMSDKKLNENDVPRSVMKTVHKRLTSVVEGAERLTNAVKCLDVTDDGADKPPQVIVDMTKSLAAEVRSFLPSTEVPIEKRGVAESVLSLADITKREEELEKAGAVSYLVRDRYVDVVQSVTEYMTTYVDGIEHDDAGPMLIPVGLDSSVDKAASELETLVEEYDTIEEIPAHDELDTESVDVEKCEDMSVRDAFGQIMKMLSEVSVPTGTTVSSTPPSIVGEPQETIDMIEETTEQAEATTDEVEAEVSETEATESSETETEETVEEPVEKNDNLILSAIESLEKKLEAKFEHKFDEVAKSLDSIRKMAEASEEKVDKALRKRADSRGGAPDRTTKVTEKSNGKDDGSFSSVLGLRSAE